MPATQSTNIAVLQTPSFALQKQSNEPETYLQYGNEEFNPEAFCSSLLCTQLYPDFSPYHPSKFLSTSSVTIADYGCGTGKNSITPLKQLLSTLRVGGTANIVLNDRKGNNWSSVAAVIDDAHEDLSRNRWGQQLNVYFTLSTRDFYNQIMPYASVDVGFAWSSFHCLAHGQHMDFVKLLCLRSFEIKKNGCLFISVPKTCEKEIAKTLDNINVCDLWRVEFWKIEMDYLVLKLVRN